MKKLWPSYTMRNDDFWEYQWAKHERCSFPGFTQITYLRKVINAFESLHLFEALQIANIVPVDHRLPHRYYYRQDLIQDVGDRIGFHQIQPELVCHGEELTEVRYCISHDAFQLVNCTNIGTCGRRFLFLIYPQGPRGIPDYALHIKISVVLMSHF